MAHGHPDFDERLRRVGRRHRSMANGYAFRMRSDGLLVAEPRRPPPAISIRSILLFLASIIVFKAFILAHEGPDGYEDRLARLSAGSLPEQIGAFVMRSDPASRFIAGQMGPTLR